MTRSYRNRMSVAAVIAVLGAHGAVAADVPAPAVAALAQAALGDARQWQGDAALVEVGVQNQSQYAYAVATGHPYDYTLTFVSPQSRQALLMSFAASYSDQVAPADRLPSLPLPAGFIDLPAALERARMSGPMDHAMLQVWQKRGGAAVAAWVIAPKRFDPYRPVAIVEATTGRLLAPNAVFDAMPGNDAQIGQALEAMRRTFAPPPPPPAPTSLPGAAPSSKCVLCIVRYGQAQQYVINHPGATISQGYAATSH